VALENDGKIVVAGYVTVGTDYDFAIARLNANGTLDESFNGTGTRTLDFGVANHDQCFGVAIQTVDGTRRIVLVGSSEDSSGIQDFGIARLTDSGALDLTFNASRTMGRNNHSFGGTDAARAVAIDSSNRIVVAGDSNVTGQEDMVVLRLNTDGTEDTTFGSEGERFASLGASTYGLALALQTDGKIVVAGSEVGSSADFVVVRFTPTTGLDTTFGGGDGVASVDFGGTDFVAGVAIQHDGKIVVAGYTDQGPLADNGAVLRLTSAGALDPTFNPVASPTSSNGNGRLTFDAGGNDQVRAMVLDAYDRIVVAGQSTAGSPSFDFLAARVLGTPSSEVSVANGVLSFNDRDNVANNITVSRTATAVVFTDPAELIFSNFAAPTHTLSVPIDNVSKLSIFTQGGDDRVTLKLAGLSFTNGFSVNLGAGKDTLLASANTNFTVTNTKLTTGLGSGTLAGVDRVILQGGNGANRLDALNYTGIAVLDGGAGNDTLLAGNGRSILIGGLGKDKLTGGARQDILIGGRTTLNIFQPGFVLLIDKWAGAGAYKTRVAQLRAGTGLPAGLKLTKATVPDDKAADTLAGGGDLDWFWSYTLDFLKDKAANELLR
jgi:uncharacterized delta-60 repeat protein